MSTTTKAQQGRLGLLLTLYHYQPGKQVQSLAHKPISTYLVGTDQPYSRTVTLNKEWAPLDLGWIADPGLVVFQSLLPYRTRHPSDDERQADLRKVIQVALDWADPTPDILIPFGWPLPIYFSRPKQVGLRCADGAIDCCLTVYPK